MIVSHTMTSPHGVAHGPNPARLGLFAAEPVFATLGLLLAASLAVTLPALALDPRTVLGTPVWLKPVKFQIALSVYLLTLAVYARFLPAGMTDARTYRAYSLLVAAAIVLEMAWIGGAALHGVPSHFNVATPFSEIVYALMGALAVILTSAALVHGIAIWREDGHDPLRLSLGLGLVLTFCLTVPVAGYLSSQGGHLVGVPETGAAVPLLGWSREVGDLRVAHFLATHAMHVLPLVGLVAARSFAPGAARRTIWAGAGLFVLIVAVAFLQALSGRPVF